MGNTVVTLLPSATEIVCALGLSESLVGISHDCDYPPEIRNRPVLSEAIVGAELPSRAIDESIRGQIHKGKSVYHLDEAQLAELRPDLILTQELCEVCAPSYTLVQQAAKVLDADTKIVSLEPLGLTDVLDNISLVGELTGTRTRARHLVTQIYLLEDRSGWCELRAVRDQHVYLTEATSYFSRPGPRLVDGLEILASILHPGVRFEIPAGSLERL